MRDVFSHWSLRDTPRSERGEGDRSEILRVVDLGVCWVKLVGEPLKPLSGLLDLCICVPHAAHRSADQSMESWSQAHGVDDDEVAVPPWPRFLRACVRYRESLDRELQDAPVQDQEFEP